MKTRLHKFVLTVLIAVFCCNCVTPIFAAEKMTDSEKRYFEESLEASKKSFLNLYLLLWEKHGLDQKLKTVIRRAVDEKMKSMQWGTRHIRTLFFSKVAEEAQELIVEKFNPDYEKFTLELENRFGKENNRLVANFFKNISAEAAEKYKDPAIRNYIIQTTKEILKKDAEILHKHIAVSLTNKGLIAVGEGAASFGLFLLSRVYKQKLITFFMSKLGLGTILTGVGGKLAEVAIPVVGQFLALYEGWRALKVVLNAPDDLKTKLETGLIDHFRTTQPNNYWEVIGEGVRSMYEESYSMFLDNIKEAEEFPNDPEYKALLESREKNNQPATSGETD